METCKPVTGLHLDERSRKAIERIRWRIEQGGALAVVLSAGVFARIFVNEKPLGAALNISQMDWNRYAEAMRAIPGITRAAVRREYRNMVVHYQAHYDRNLLHFWKGLYDACK